MYNFIYLLFWYRLRLFIHNLLITLTIKWTFMYYWDLKESWIIGLSVAAIAFIVHILLRHQLKMVKRIELAGVPQSTWALEPCCSRWLIHILKCLVHSLFPFLLNQKFLVCSHLDNFSEDTFVLELTIVTTHPTTNLEVSFPLSSYFPPSEYVKLLW